MSHYLLYGNVLRYAYMGYEYDVYTNECVRLSGSPDWAFLMYVL